MTTWRKAQKKPIAVLFREVEPKTDISVVRDGKPVMLIGETIHTREGTIFGIVGEDYIMRGIEGELYPIKKTIFKKTYNVIGE